MLTLVKGIRERLALVGPSPEISNSAFGTAGMQTGRSIYWGLATRSRAGSGPCKSEEGLIVLRCRVPLTGTYHWHSICSLPCVHEELN